MPTNTTTTNNKPLYTDLDLIFTRHPVKNDVNIFTNEQAIIASVRNLVLTSKFESPFDPNLGSNVRKLLFENWSPAVDAMLAQLIAEVVQTYEPRVILEQIDVSYDEGNAGYYITLFFTIKTIPNRTFSGSFFLLEKAR